MMSLVKLLCVFVMFAAPAVYSLGLTEEERLAAKNAAAPLIAACAKENGEKLEHLKAAFESHDLHTVKPCTLACIYKKTGMLTDDGLFDAEQNLPKSSKYVVGFDFSKIVTVVKSCASVNEKSVTDGTEGCQRAKLLADCMVQFKKAYAVL